MGFYKMKTSKNYNFENYIIHQFDILDSTNSTAFELAQNRKIFANEVIWSLQQKNGRGRLERKWQSPAGNLYFSLVLQPNINDYSQLKINDIPQISFIANCALNQVLTTIFQQQKVTKNIQNKWPNDLLIEEKKVAGILLESKISDLNCEFIILGIGVNINSSPIETIFPATNLHEYAIEVSAQILLENFLSAFTNLYQNWLRFGFKNLAILWNNNAYKINEIIKINIGNKAIEGKFLGIDNFGFAQIFSNNEIRKINYGEVC